MKNLNWPRVRSLLSVFLSLSLTASALPSSAWAVDAAAFGREASETRIISPVVIPENDLAIGNNSAIENSGENGSLLSDLKFNADASNETISNDKEKTILEIPRLNDAPARRGISSNGEGSQGSADSLPKDHSLSQEYHPQESSQKFEALNNEKTLVIANEVRRGVAAWEDGRERQEGATNIQDNSSADLTRLTPPILLLSGPKADLPLPQETSLPGDGAPKTSKFKSAMCWALPILSMTAVVVGLDVATKLLAKKYLLTEFHDAPWRAPFIAVIIPYMGFTAYKARAGLAKARKLWQWSIKAIRNGRFGFSHIAVSGTDEMMKKHPSLLWAVRLYDVSIAMMMGGLLGNGLDMLRLGGALDWIPLGRSLLNLADVSLLIGLAFFQLATHFFISAGEADSSGKSLRFSVTSFLGLPLLGFFIAWTFGSAPGGSLLDLAMKNIEYLYLIGFSMLLGISRYLAAVIVGIFASRFTSESEEHKNQGS